MDRFYSDAQRSALIQAARLDEQRRINAQKADLAAEHRAVFGDGPPGGGGQAAFSGDSQSQSTAPRSMSEADRLKLLSYCPAGRALLAQQARLATQAALGTQPGSATTGKDQGELDRLLSLTETGRFALKARRDRERRAAGI